MRIAQAAAPEIDTELAEITGGAVTGINQVARLLVWLQRARMRRRKPRPESDRTAAREGRAAAGSAARARARQDGGQAAVKKIGTLLAARRRR